ncbi:MAG: DNA translocase FtsK 4TM domain-containing protein [Actinomycetota bacterium]|nr:DNA translocase FtsK 4TM domain-containing protein [Actinomycetota bacterium]MDA3029067.1 DNA translocase FtsK 4TM domain-containing protein [Actinomycetota bacterium]
MAQRPKKSTSPNRAPAKGSRASGSKGSPSGRGRSSVPAHGRDSGFIGVILIAVGVLFALALWFGLAGPLGDGADTVLAWLLGVGRRFLPLALVAGGVALVREGETSSPARLGAGWTMVTLAFLGLVHVINTPSALSDLDALGDAGGLLGVVVGEPSERLLAPAGAGVLLSALLIGGIAIITRTTLRTMALQTGQGVGAVLRPLGRYVRRSVSELSTLQSERAEIRRRRAADADDDLELGQATSGLAPSIDPLATPPTLYDLAADDEFAEGTVPPQAKTSRRKKDPAVSKPAAPVAPATQVTPGQWVLPPIGYLEQTGVQTVDMKGVEERGRTLQESLAQHGVETQLVGSTVGPTVTRFELELGPGVKVAKVTSLQRDIAYAMAATDVRILAPIPGRSAIGVEVPNAKRQLVALGDLLVSAEAGSATHPLEVAIGKDIAGRAVFLNLATTPHLLIAGATGAGKSSGINCIITSLLMRTTPEQVRLILIDPKQVEMGQYQRLPHLLTQPVTNPKKAANALGWAVKEMEKRYDVLSECGYRDITGYNAAVLGGSLSVPAGREASEYEHMPYIVLVVDELNDLMMVAARDVEESITRIAQKARAVGIHLIVATQRPSVNVITGVIKANVPARMAFAVSSLTDSRVILDQPGAEKLVGKGDMLLLPGNSSVANRIQGSWVGEEEVRKVVDHWRAQAPEPIYSENVEADPGAASGGSATPPGFASDLDVTSDANAFSAGDDDEDTAIMRQAIELVVRSQLGSTSMLQRKLKVGFARAGRIMDLLEQRGVVGPSEGSKAREVLMSVEEFELLRQNGQI